MESLVNEIVGDYEKIRRIVESRGNNPNWLPELMEQLVRDAGELAPSAEKVGTDTYQTILRVLADVEKVGKACLAESTEIEKTKAVLSAIQAMKDYATIHSTVTRHLGLLHSVRAWLSQMFSCCVKSSSPSPSPAVLTSVAPSSALPSTEPEAPPAPVLEAVAAPVLEAVAAPALEAVAAPAPALGAVAAPAPALEAVAAPARDSDPRPRLPESPPSSDESSDEKR